VFTHLCLLQKSYVLKFLAKYRTLSLFSFTGAILNKASHVSSYEHYCIAIAKWFSGKGNEVRTVYVVIKYTELQLEGNSYLLLRKRKGGEEKLVKDESPVTEL